MGFADEAASLAQTIKFGKEADGQQNLAARAFTIIIPMSILLVRTTVITIIVAVTITRIILMGLRVFCRT